MIAGEGQSELAVIFDQLKLRWVQITQELTKQARRSRDRRSSTSKAFCCTVPSRAAFSTHDAGWLLRQFSRALNKLPRLLHRF